MGPRGLDLNNLTTLGHLHCGPVVHFPLLGQETWLGHPLLEGPPGHPSLRGFQAPRGAGDWPKWTHG